MTVERRISHQLVDYWQSIKGEHILPTEQDIDPEDIQSMWADCFLISLHADARGEGDIRASYQYLGEHLRLIYIDDEGGGAHLLTLPQEKLEAAYREMVMTKLPIIESVEEFLLEQGGYMKYRQCLVPLGTRDGTIYSLLGGMRFKYA